jgi:muconolactone delta-isomerase
METEMLFHVYITVHIPHGADPEKIKILGAEEHERAKELQQQGKCLHLCRVAGKFANLSVFNVDDPADVLVQPEMEKRRSPLVSIPPSGGDFQGMGSFDPMEVGRRKNESSRPRPSSR